MSDNSAIEWTDAVFVWTPEEAKALPTSQWVVDAEGTSRCLVDTKIGWHQWLVRHIQNDLYGKDLVCWCRPDQPCHADVLLALANGGGL